MGDILTVKVGSNKVSYFHFGNGQQPFIILPGLSIESVMLLNEAVEQSYADFKNDYCVYVFDRPKVIEKGDTIEKIADITAQAIISLGLQNCYIFGASQGGMMGLTIAVHYPNLVKKLIVGSSLAKVNDTARNCISNWIYLAKQMNRQELVNSFVERVYCQETIEQYGDYLRAGWQDITDEELERFVLLAESSADFDCENQLDQLNCEMLVLGAYNDQVVTGDSSIQLAKKTNCQLYMYEKFGHGVYDEAPDYKNRILAFLNQER